MTPDRQALGQGATTMSYLELARSSDRLASAFTAMGVRAGDRIAYLGPNDITAFETFFAAGTLGGIFVPLNTRLAAPEIDFMLTDSAADVLVVAPTHHQLLGALTVRPRVVALEPETCPVECLGYETLHEQDVEIPDVAVGFDDSCLILYTSGTTGTPKGAVLSHGNLTFNTLNQLAHIDVLSTDRALGLAPMFHVTGLNQVTLPTLFKGGVVLPVQEIDGGEVLASIEREHVSSFSAVPTILQMLCDHPDWSATDLSSIRYVVYGGSPVHERVARAWLDRGVDLLQGYGMTEAAAGVYMSVSDGAADHPTSVGFPHFFTDVVLGDVADDALSPVGPDTSGELLITGPNVFREYWNRPAASDAAFTDGWYRTGDVIHTDTDGWTTVIDRLKDIIISGGENIYPAEVEAALATIPGVAAAAVVGVPDEQWGEVGTAFIVAAGEHPPTGSEITRYLTGRIARYKIPKHYTFVSEIPRNATGKIRRTELRDIATAAPTP